MRFDVESERKKILSGEYPSRIIQGKQRKHLPDTREFQQNRNKMQRLSPGSEPAIFASEINIELLVNSYKGTGNIKPRRGSQYPQEIVKADRIIGYTWLNGSRKYIETNTFVIVYSKSGVHAYPVNAHSK